MSRNIKISLLFVSALVIMSSFLISPKSFSSQKLSNHNYSLTNETEKLNSNKVKLKLKQGCGKKIGFCILFGLDPNDKDVTPIQFKQGYGNADATFDEAASKVTLKFGRPATEGEPFADIYGDWDLGSDYANLLGLNSIIVKKGIYPIDLSVGEFGEATFDVITE